MDWKEVIYKRRALRALDAVEISDEFIKEVANLAARAPSCGNNQPWRFIFVKEKAVLDKLKETLTDGNYWAKDASMLIAVFSNKEFDCLIDKREYYLFDTGMATILLMLAIVEKGLVAHAMAGFDEEVAKKTLNIPEEMRLLTLIAVGKHSEKIDDKLSEKHAKKERIVSERKNFDEFAFFDTYKK